MPDNALSDAVNVDITDSGSVIVRNGYAHTKTFNVSSVHSTQAGDCFVISDTTSLCRIDNNLNLLYLIDSTATSFCDYGDLFFTNDGIMVKGSDAIDLKLLRPPFYPPDISSGANPESPPGIYSAMQTISDRFGGLESGTSPVVSIEMDGSGGITGSSTYPYPTIYYSNATGTGYFTDEGTQLQPWLIGAEGFPENVSQVEFFDGSLYCSVDNGEGSSALIWSLPFLYHLFNYSNNFAIIPGSILSMCKVNAGLLIGTDSAIFIFDGQYLTRFVNYGVIQGTSMVKLPDGEALVYTKRGICKTGEPFQNMTENTVSLPLGSICHASLVYQNGIKKLIVLNDGDGEAFNKSF